MQKYALFMFFIAECYGFPETAFFFFSESLIFVLSKAV